MEPVEGHSPADAGTEPASPKRRGSHAPERTCILTRTHGTPETLVRLALSPDGEVLPDVRGKAPGRGAWIGVGRGELEAALAKGRLKAALARAFKSGAVRAPDDLSDRIEAALRQAALDRLGLEAKAGTLISGSEKVETAARRGEVHLLIHAADAAEDGRRKLDQALRAGDGDRRGVVFPEDRTILSLALGRQNVVHAAIIDRAAAQRVRLALGRWAAFIGRDAGLSAATADAAAVSAVDVNEG
ncbi:MAG: DUF448 domain-containing protein [Allosphingosinicella sp.]|uniref:DUF448 domain-containing protein n=1 Tax=Allosphingosinicella sp. TaxID=2823234 RepID=UPI00394F73FA